MIGWCSLTGAVFDRHINYMEQLYDWVISGSIAVQRANEYGTAGHAANKQKTGIGRLDSCMYAFKNVSTMHRSRHQGGT